MFLIDQLADCLGCKPLHELLDLTIPNFESVYQSVTYSNRLRIFSNRNRLGIFWVFFESVRIGSNRLVFSNRFESVIFELVIVHFRNKSLIVII